MNFFKIGPTPHDFTISGARLLAKYPPDTVPAKRDPRRRGKGAGAWEGYLRRGAGRAMPALGRRPTCTPCAIHRMVGP